MQEIKQILEEQGLEQAIKRADELGLHKELRLFAYWIAKQCERYVPVEDRKAYNKALNTINLFAYSEVDAAARDAACADAWYSARTAARTAAFDAAWYSAWHAACTAAFDAAFDTTCDAAGYAAWHAAWDTTESKFIDIVINKSLPAKVKTTNHF
jgi:hypothetical protein